MDLPSRVLFEMVQNKRAQPAARPGAKRSPGRPRAYDPETALQQAIQAFWKTGYSGTSLDDIAAATGMNRPSLYLAFGDKRALYLKALHHYWQLGYAAMDEALAYDRPLPEALMRVYHGALAMYFSGGGHPRGCFAIGTATTEAVEDPEIREALMDGLRTLDDRFAMRIRAAQGNGEISRAAVPTVLAMLASGTLHSIAVRARSGASRAELEQLARDAVSIICRA